MLCHASYFLNKIVKKLVNQSHLVIHNHILSYVICVHMFRHGNGSNDVNFTTLVYGPDNLQEGSSPHVPRVAPKSTAQTVLHPISGASVFTPGLLSS